MPADPKRVKELFLAATDLPVANRLAFLEGACGGDAELLAGVERLLAAHVDTESRVERSDKEPAANPAKATIVTEAPIAKPDRDPDPTSDYHPVDSRGLVLAGRYKLMEPIGEGGMGSVWMAQQIEPVKRPVAVKLIKAGMDSAAVLARFEAERQALAMMDHPNIAKVLDAGMSDNGQPFFVMELVKGVAITKFCDARKLTPRERLELFVPVCHAIQHAHQKGIIHRDIKPSNVLVALYDDSPVVKVIDFGVAKAAGKPLTDKTLMTGFGAVIGTPEYMSPEQASFNQMDVDTRSDVYSLGVLLYELLTGSPPHRRKELEQAGLLEVLRVIREIEPPRPSTRLSTSHTLASLAAVRGTEPARLTRLVRGELDWIVMKALDKDRTRRYETANGFAAEVQRYLAGEPVQAVPPSAGFVRRHRAGVLTAAAFAVLLLAGAAISTWQAVVATHAEREAQVSENAARVSEEVAQEQKHKADEARNEAETRSDQLVKLNDTLFLANYISDMNLARVAWDANNLDRCRELVNKHRPSARDKDQRGFEWHYLNRLLHGNELIIKAYSGWVTSVAFTPDGKRLLSSGTSQRPLTRNEKVQLTQWDVETGQPLPFQFDLHREAADPSTIFGTAVERIAFNHDGTRMAASCRDQTIRVWDNATGTLSTLEGPKKHTISSVNFSPDGKWLVSLHQPDESPLFEAAVHSLKIWDLATRKSVVTLDRLHGVRQPRFSPDGRLLALPSRDGNVVKVLNAATGDVVYECKYAGGLVGIAMFDPAGTRLAGSGENGVQIWDTATHQLIATLPSGGNNGLCMDFSPDGKRLATGSIDGVVEVWETRAWQKLQTLKGHSGYVRTLLFSPDGRRLATGGSDGSLRLWDSTGGPGTIAISTPVGGGLPYPYFSPDGQTVLYWNATNVIGLWDANTGEARGVIRRVKTTGSGFWSADGRRIYIVDDTNAIVVVEAATAKVVRELQIDASTDRARYAFSVDEKWFAHDGGPGATEIKVRNLQTGAELCTLRGHEERAHRLLFTSDSSRLMTADFGGTLKLWDVATGREIATTKFPGMYINGIEFSPDGKRLAVTGNRRRSLSGEAWIVDAENLREVWSLKGHTLNVTDAVFSPDGQRLATSSADRTIRLWDLRTGQEILKLRDSWGMMSLRFVSDGRRLRSGSFDGTIRVWDATPLPE